MDGKATPQIPPPPAPVSLIATSCVFSKKRMQALTRIQPQDNHAVITFSKATCQRHFHTLKSLISTQEALTD